MSRPVGKLHELSHEDLYTALEAEPRNRDIILEAFNRGWEGGDVMEANGLPFEETRAIAWGKRP